MAGLGDMFGASFATVNGQKPRNSENIQPENIGIDQNALSKNSASNLLRGNLYPGEDSYFKENPSVTGMAAEDGKVIINPYSTLKPEEKNAVYMNEASRLWMRGNGTPDISITPEQENMLVGTTYKDASREDRAATILARIISGDPSSGKPTDEQLSTSNELRKRIFGIGEQTTLGSSFGGK